MADILIYGGIWSYSVMWFYDQIAQAIKDDPETAFTFRVNSTGGSPEYMTGMVTKYLEIDESKKSVIAEGRCDSSALFFLVYAGDASAVDTAQGVLHRAAYDSWIESASSFPGSLYEQMVIKLNKDLEKAMRARIDVDALENLPQMKSKNLTLKSIFSMESREEVLLSAQDMKKIGLIKTIVQITPKKSAEIKTLAAAFSDSAKFENVERYRVAAQAAKGEKEDETKTDTPMTAEEFKSKFPLVYAAILAEGVKTGIEQEQDRVGAIMVFAETDPKACADAVASGKPLTQKQVVELTMKSIKAEALSALGKEGKTKVETTAESAAKAAAEAEKNKDTENPEATAAFEDALTAKLKLTKEKVAA